MFPSMPKNRVLHINEETSQKAEKMKLMEPTDKYLKLTIDVNYECNGCFFVLLLLQKTVTLDL